MSEANSHHSARSQAVSTVLAAVDELTPALVQTLAEAVQIPSVNPRYPGQNYTDHIGRE